MKIARSKFTRHVNIKIPYIQRDVNILNSIKSLLENNKGNCRFILNIETSSGYMQRVVSEDFNVSSKIEFISQLRELLGTNNVWLNS